MTLTFRDTKGSNLTAAEVDANFRDLDGRVDALETYGAAAETITNVTVSGSLLTVFTSGGQEFAVTISIPRAPATSSISTTTYEAVLGDADKMLLFTNAGGCAFNVPDEATVDFNLDAEIRIRQVGAGAVTITGDTGVTITGRSGHDLATALAGDVVVLKKTGADTWIAWGDLATTSV